MITTIIFDFAGVISKRNFFPVVAEKLSEKYGISKEKVFENLKIHATKYILGQESTRDFWEKVCGEFNIPFDEFVKIFGSSYELNLETIELIRRLKKKYRIFLLSDNFDALSKVIRLDTNIKDIFERMYFSDEMHLIKEDPNAFYYMLNDIKKKPEECIFIDDKEMNLVEPKKIGMHTILFNDTETLEKDLANLGIVL